MDADTSARSERHVYSSQSTLLNYAIITVSNIIKAAELQTLLTPGEAGVSEHLEEDIFGMSMAPFPTGTATLLIWTVSVESHLSLLFREIPIVFKTRSSLTAWLKKIFIHKMTNT